MDWVKMIELRSRARVPIISFVTRSCIACDISLGMQSKHTTDLVTQMRDNSGAEFLPVAVFLKMFLTLQELDQPFTGGIGSFKLYAMVAFIIDKFRRERVNFSSRTSSNTATTTTTTSTNDLGPILLEFFSYFGQRRNLNIATTIKIYDTEVSFDTNRKVDVCQSTFQQAYLALSIAIGKQERGESHIPYMSSSRNQHSTSNSLLGLIIDTEELQKRREESLRSCRLYPARNEIDRAMVATKLVGELNSLTLPKPPVALEDISKHRPFLMTMLRSFPSVALAMKCVKASNIRPSSSSSGSSYSNSSSNLGKSHHNHYHHGRQFENHKKNGRVVSTDYDNHHSYRSSDQYIHENARTGMKRKVATFSRGGVVGSSFQTTTNNDGSASAKKAKKSRSSSKGSSSVSSNSNGSRSPSVSSGAIAKEKSLRNRLIEKMKGNK